MAIRNSFFLYAFISLLWFGCGTVLHVSKTNVQYVTVSSSDQPTDDDVVTALIAPYKEQIDAEMNEVVGEVGAQLTKGKPESTLGNWYTDAMVAGAKRDGHDVHFALANYGGLRTSHLYTGPLTKGELYELSPFDNMLLIVEVPGHILDSLFQNIAASGGWPMSQEVRMVIQDSKMIDCTVLGKPITPTAIYKVAMPDYIANGGDGLNFLIPLPRIQTGKLIRDLLIAEAMLTQASGQKVSAKLDDRIVIRK